MWRWRLSCSVWQPRDSLVTVGVSSWRAAVRRGTYSRANTHSALLPSAQCAVWAWQEAVSVWPLRPRPPPRTHHTCTSVNCGRYQVLACARELESCSLLYRRLKNVEIRVQWCGKNNSIIVKRWKKLPRIEMHRTFCEQWPHGAVTRAWASRHVWSVLDSLVTRVNISWPLPRDTGD